MSRAQIIEETAPGDGEPATPEELGGLDPRIVDHDDRLILWMLERTPTQRLEALQSFADGVAVLQHARKI